MHNYHVQRVTSPDFKDAEVLDLGYRGKKRSDNGRDFSLGYTPDLRKSSDKASNIYWLNTLVARYAERHGISSTTSAI